MIKFEMEVVQQKDQGKKIKRFKGEISLSLFKIIPFCVSVVELSQKLFEG